VVAVMAAAPRRFSARERILATRRTCGYYSVIRGLTTIVKDEPLPAFFGEQLATSS
jgi:hypothetical protein